MYVYIYTYILKKFTPGVYIYLFLYRSICVCVYLQVYTPAVYIDIDVLRLVTPQAEGKAAATEQPHQLPPAGEKAADTHRKAPSSQGKAAGAGSRCSCCSGAGGTGSGVPAGTPSTPEHRARLSPSHGGLMLGLGAKKERAISPCATCPQEGPT